MSAFYGLSDNPESATKLELLARTPLDPNLVEGSGAFGSMDIPNLGGSVLRAGVRAGTGVAITGTGLAARALPEEASKELDPIFENIDVRSRAMLDALTPNPRDVGAASRVVGEVVEGFLPYLLGPTVGGLSTSVRTAQDLSGLGIDSGSTTAASILSGTTGTLAATLPIFGRSLMERVVVGATGSVGVGSAAREGTEAIVAASNKPELAEQFGASPETVITDLLLGGAFGGLSHYLHGRVRSKDLVVAPKQGETPDTGPGSPFADAAQTLHTADHARRGTAPGEPADLASYNIHRAAVERSINSLLRDEPVDVPANVTDAGFIRTPSAAHLYMQEFRRVLDGEEAASGQALVAAAPTLSDAELVAKSDDFQRQIDAFEEGLEKQGVDPTRLYPFNSKELEGFENYKPMPKELEALYNQRDAIDHGLLDKSISAVRQDLSSIGLSEPEIKRVLQKYALVEEGAGRVYLAAQHSQSHAIRPVEQQAQDIYFALAAERNVPFDDTSDAFRDVKTTEDALRVAKAVSEYLTTGKRLTPEPQPIDVTPTTPLLEEPPPITLDTPIGEALSSPLPLPAAKPVPTEPAPAPQKPSAELGPKPVADEPEVAFIRQSLETQGDVMIPTGEFSATGAPVMRSGRELLAEADLATDYANTLAHAMKAIGGCNPEVSF